MPRFLILLTALFLLLILLGSCGRVIPKGSVVEYNHPSKPNYENAAHWAALPERLDSADRVPHPSLKNIQAQAEVDVFFLHPTTYLGKKGEDQWNGPVDQDQLNQRTDEGSIKNQASIFNGVGRVYAPRYRQAHYHSYFTSDTLKAARAFQLAYEDVKDAFEYYLSNFNNGRPIIIAAHSQGTTHAAQLLLDYFDGKILQDQLIAAYLVGMPIPVDIFDEIKVCERPEQTGCFNSWRTWQKGHFPDNYEKDNSLAVTNPLIWTTSEAYAPRELNKGSVLRNFEESFYPEITDAQVEGGILWITKPKFPWSFLVRFKNYHIADYNLYYVNVRNNAQLRASTYLHVRAQEGNTSQ